MIKFSKIHQDFANRLLSRYNITKQDVLNHPEKYLGPNWEAVINFWLYLDTLNKKQLKVVEERYRALSEEQNDIDYNRAEVATKATIRYAFDASYSASDSVSCAKPAAYYATEELIGLDKLLEQGYQPVFFPMFLDL
jgi:hypothetical protein